MTRYGRITAMGGAGGIAALTRQMLTGAIVTVLVLCSCSGRVPPVPKPQVEGFDPEVRDVVMTAYQQAVSQPLSGPASGRFGMVLHAHAMYPLAAAAYQRAIRLQPDEFAWRYYLALTLAQMAKPDEALKALSEALRKRPGYAPAMLKKGELLFQLGRLSESQSAYEALLAEEPRSAAALEGLARVKVAQKDMASAEDLYRKACEVFPSFGAAYYGLATAARALGKEADAATNFALAQRYSGKSPPAEDPVLDQIGEVAAGSSNELQAAGRLLQQGKLDEAANLYEEILKRDPARTSAWIQLLYLARFLNRLDSQVDSLYAGAVRLNPKVPEFYNNYGAALLRQGKIDAAAVALRKAIELKPDYAEAHTWLGELLESQHRTAEALSEYQRALAADPSYRKARIQLGRVLVNLQRDREAISDLLPAVQVEDEQTSFVLVLLGEAYLYTGDRRTARLYLEQARARVRAEGPPGLLAEIEDELSQAGPLP
ncbi:MAG TPA: tetratricopeptide repeat protein [Bryobacteraceae bacterium]